MGKGDKSAMLALYQHGPVSLHWLIRKIASYQTLQYFGIGIKHKTPETGLKLVAILLMSSNKKISTDSTIQWIPLNCNPDKSNSLPNCNWLYAQTLELQNKRVNNSKLFYKKVKILVHKKPKERVVYPSVKANFICIVMVGWLYWGLTPL